MVICVAQKTCAIKIDMILPDDLFYAGVMIKYWNGNDCKTLQL